MSKCKRKSAEILSTYCAQTLKKFDIDPERIKVKSNFLLPKSEDAQNELIRACVAWAMKDDSMEIDEFPAMMLMSPYRFYKIADTNEYFRNGLEISKSLIANRLKRDVRKRNLDKDYLFKLLPLYSQDYRDLHMEKWKNSDNNSPIQLLMPKFYNSEDEKE